MVMIGRAAVMVKHSKFRIVIVFKIGKKKGVVLVQRAENKRFGLVSGFFLTPKYILDA